MIPLKTKEEVEIMTEGGKITAQALSEVLKNIQPGVSAYDLDQIAEKVITEAGAEPAFKEVKGYNFATCINLNEGIVHGIPHKELVIKEGDLVSCDLGTYYRDFYTDASWTVLVGKDANKARFLEAGRKALERAILSAQVGKRVGDVSFAIGSVLSEYGFSPTYSLVGHGIGRSLHEEPQIPCFGEQSRGEKLEEGMTFAVEVIYVKGSPHLKTLEDGWTMETIDKSWSALFEKTIAIAKDGPIVLTEF